MMVEIERNKLEDLQWKLRKYIDECNKLREQLREVEDRNRSLNWRIDRELEPRLKAERDAYDRWVTEDTGAEACECFSSLLDDLIEFVEDEDNKKYLEWESADGDLESKILYLIKNKEDDAILCIAEKE